MSVLDPVAETEADTVDVDNASVATEESGEMVVAVCCGCSKDWPGLDRRGVLRTNVPPLPP